MTMLSLPRPLLLALLLTGTLHAEELDPKTLPAVKRVLEKATEEITRNRRAYDEANQKTIDEAKEEIAKEIDRLAKAGKLEEAVAVKRFSESFGGQVVANGEKKLAPPNPAQQGAAAWQGHKYKVFKEACSWHEAKKRCEEMGGHLVIIDSKKEQDFVTRSLLRNSGGKVVVWQGITCDGTPGRWQTVKEEPLSFTEWYPGEPTCSDHRESCGVIDMVRMGGRWNDVPLSERLTFVCEWDE